jgi:hypothetical protein
MLPAARRSLVDATARLKPPERVRRAAAWLRCTIVVRTGATTDPVEAAARMTINATIEEQCQ